MLVLAAAGCGGGDGSGGEALLPAGVGGALADKADAVAVDLGRGDLAGARTDAQALRQAVEQAIAAGKVPAALRQPLRAAVSDLVASIPAPPPATSTEEEGDDDKGKGKGKKGKGKGKH